MRARPSAIYLLPYHPVRPRLQLAEVCLALAGSATARQLLREIDDIVRRRKLGVSSRNDAVQRATSTGLPGG